MKNAHSRDIMKKVLDDAHWINIHSLPVSVMHYSVLVLRLTKFVFANQFLHD